MTNFYHANTHRLSEADYQQSLPSNMQKKLQTSKSIEVRMQYQK